ncbi:MAG: hypothetical protein IH596_13265 [Bacteroidales bacterium]|nr:hypothetical protein [Bacteroidales bacterium]
MVADVSKPEDIRMLQEEIRKKFGRLHILVTNAGGPHTQLQDLYLFFFLGLGSGSS